MARKVAKVDVVGEDIEQSTVRHRGGGKPTPGIQVDERDAVPMLPKVAPKLTPVSGC
jgi:hypothetical protein